MALFRGFLILLLGVLLQAAPPKRVVSHAVGTDDLLLALAEPSQIAALSALSKDPRYSPHAREAAPFKALHKGEAEDILATRPDLVILTSYSPVEVRTLLQRAKVKLFLVDHYETFDDLCAVALALGKELGRESQARAVVAGWRHRLATLKARLKGAPRLRVMAAGIYPFASGANTTFQDLCDQLGLVNVAAEAGLVGHVPMPAEKALTWRVDRLIGPREAGTDLPARLRELAPYKHMPALKQGRLVEVDGALLASTSHRRLDAYEAVARALFPDRFR